MGARRFSLRRLDHVQLAMPAGAEGVAESFYVGVLGLTRVEKPPALAVRGGCWFRGGELELHLGVEGDFRPARKAHPAMRVDGLDALAEALQAAGHEVRWSDEVPGTRRFHTDDPFGNRLEFIAAPG
jgi:catechol 2,3-dioxygenase-like lactoylglutathione lyase family enzyme